ncbi:MAG: DUF4405 domain-containing protein [Anaerolineae bacterium]|nr:DUF4405 domain-containing protein [Anaerolineae bacterium]
MRLSIISKIAVDSLMLILLIAQMGRHFLSDVVHEWIGAGMFVLFVAHHILNLHWYQTIFKGRHTPYRMFRFGIDIAVFVTMIGLLISAFILSQHINVFFTISSGKSFARIVHMLASYWGLVLMSLHLGVHWEIFVNMLRKSIRPIQLLPIQNALLSIIGIVIAAYGLYAFIRRDLFSYMFLQQLFVYFDYEESKILFYFDYVAMVIFFAWVSQKVTQVRLGFVASNRFRRRTVGTSTREEI